MKKFIHNSDLGLLLFRLFVGLTMAIAHGYGKLPPSEQLIQGVAGMGFPMPVVFAWAAALAEFLGGIAIAIGLFTRFSALSLGFTMAMAAFIVHAQDAFQVKELAFFYLASCVLLIFTGAGKYSVDKILCKKS